MGLLDKRARPTTEAERAKMYALPDPTEGERFTIATREYTCERCETRYGNGLFVWLRDVSDDPEYVEIARVNGYRGDKPLYVPVCEHCARKHFCELIREYANERAQCEREERLEAAVKAEADGLLTPEHWTEIMIANLGYAEPKDLDKRIGGMVLDFRERFKAGPNRCEAVRAELWGVRE